MPAEAGVLATAAPWLLGAVLVICAVAAVRSYFKEKNKPQKVNAESEPPPSFEPSFEKCCWCRASVADLVTLNPCKHLMCRKCFGCATKTDSKCIECGKDIITPLSRKPSNQCNVCNSSNLVECRPCRHAFLCVNHIKTFIAEGGNCLNCGKSVESFI